MQSGANATGLPSSSAEAVGDGLEAHLRVRLALGAAEVGGEDEAGALFEGVLDGGQRGVDALVGGDFLAAGGERDVEIDAHEDAFALQIEIAD